MDGETLKDIQVNQLSTKYSTQRDHLFQVYLYDISIDDDRDPLARVLFKYPPDLGEDMVGLVSFISTVRCSIPPPTRRSNPIQPNPIHL